MLLFSPLPWPLQVSWELRYHSGWAKRHHDVLKHRVETAILDYHCLSTLIITPCYYALANFAIFCEATAMRFVCLPWSPPGGWRLTRYLNVAICPSLRPPEPPSAMVICWPPASCLPPGRLSRLIMRLFLISSRRCHRRPTPLSPVEPDRHSSPTDYCHRHMGAGQTTNSLPRHYVMNLTIPYN